METSPISPYEIQRPRSALHSGDFCQGAPKSPSGHSRYLSLDTEQNSVGHFGSPPTFSPFKPTAPLTYSQHERDIRSNSIQPFRSQNRSRAPSLGSFSSNYILKAPTSPLVHQANNPDLDFTPKMDLDLSANQEKANRRRTLPPETFLPFQSSPPSHNRGLNFNQTPETWRREARFFSNSYQPRRSLNSAYTLQPASSPFRSRRTSYSSDLSPLHHASMVGSYEESIIRGRMSTSPSKPLNFTAQIGVLGKGNCRPNLRCPPHVTVPFPAVFYSYPTSGSGRSISDDSPSPYVGHIDIENSLSGEDKNSHLHRQRRKTTSPPNSHDIGSDDYKPRMTPQQELRRREKRSRRSESPKSPPGGSYRIPQQGQLQIIIKNPNKTAVKLFLVPYDLDGMEPGTKTFIRQRSYSAGPTIDMPLSVRKNYGTDRPEASLNTSENPEDKPVLRYLVHLNICCTSKGRYYLYSGIRVVFANRVPDAEEKLRNEIQYPDPRYTPYKPSKESATNSANARLAAERAFKRRSYGSGVTSPAPSNIPGFGQSEPYSPYGLSDLSAYEPIDQTISPSPFMRNHSSSHDTRTISVPFISKPWTIGGEMESSRLEFPAPPLSLSQLTPDATESRPKKALEEYKKLPGSSDYDRTSINKSPTEVEKGESLLAQRLRHLDVLKPEFLGQ